MAFDKSFNCTLGTGKCSLTAIADHKELQWMYIYEETSAKAMSLFQTNDVTPRGIILCSIKLRNISKLKIMY